MNVEICEITDNKIQFLDLLLIGDEQEDMIDIYIEHSRLFIGYISGMSIACCAVDTIADEVIEIKNLAVLPKYRSRGVGRLMLKHVETLFPGKTIQLGTGETPSTLRFYHNCGYRLSHRIPDFFIDNYDHPIVEEGILLKDMIYLSKKV